MPITRRSVHTEHVMGTVVSVDLRGSGDHDAAIAELVPWFHDVDRRFSPYRADSLVHGLARDASRAEPDPDLIEVLDACDRIEAASDGAFSAWRDGRCDPSAFVKGWAADRAGVLLRRRGLDDWCVNAGGDVLVSGSPGSGRSWRVGVRSPGDPAAVVAVVAGGDLAVATSGRYERGNHLVHAGSGRPAVELASVTVVGPALGLADALSTAVFAMGAEGAAWLAAVDGYEGLVIAADGTAVATAGFPRSVHGVPVTAGRAADPIGSAA